MGLATIHLVEGPVGAGKSTFAGKLAFAQQAPHLNLDEWMVTLFSADRPVDEFMTWYAERKDRCIAQIWAVACEILDHKGSVILELGLVQAANREDFYRRVDATDYELRVFVLDVPVGERRRRVRERNKRQTDTYRMEVTDEVFELANNFWQPPSERECSERDIELVSA